MIKFFGSVQDSQGNILSGFTARVLKSDGSQHPIYRDTSGTNFDPANIVTVDTDGMVEFYYSPESNLTYQVLGTDGSIVQQVIDFASEQASISDAVAEVSGGLAAVAVARPTFTQLADQTGANLIGTESGDTVEVALVKLGDDLANLLTSVSLDDFEGFDPSGATNSDAAVLAAMQYGLDNFPNDSAFWHDGPGQPYDVNFTGSSRGSVQIIVPPGRIVVTDGIFSRLSHVRAASVGFDFVGQGPETSVFELETGGGEAWFYKNAVSDSKFQRLTFSKMGFRSDNYLYGNFINLWSDGGPKQVGVYNCHFWNLQKCLETRGTGNADLNVFAFCRGEFYGDILTLNNDQSVQHDFINCHFGTYGHIVNVKQYGGGNVSFINGSMDFVWHEEFSPVGGNFMFNEEATAVVGQGNRAFTFRNLRVEIEAYKSTAGPAPFGLVNTRDYPNLGIPRILFDDVHFVNGHTYTINGAGAILSQEYRRITAVKLFPGKKVYFNNCTLSKAFFYEVTGDRFNGSPSGGGYLKFADCFDGIIGELPAADSAKENLHDRVIYSGSAGRVVTKGTSGHTTGSAFIRKVLDADFNWRKSFGREAASVRKIVNMKHIGNGWPFADNAGNDHFVDVPTGFAALRIFVLKPAQGSNTNAYQLHLKANDRAGAIIASSTLAQFKDAHTIDLSHYDFAGVTRLCLCASGTGTDFDSGAGFAYIEYV